MPGEGCFALKNGSYPALYVEQFGPVSTDDAIMKVLHLTAPSLISSTPGPTVSRSFLRRSLLADQ